MHVVDVSAPILRWAQRRSGRHDEEMERKFKAWGKWLSKERQPTFKQVEDIAAFTHVPFGYFFLQEPPVEEVPITDFRVGRSKYEQPSDDLLETIYLNQRRQSWYEEHLHELGQTEPLGFVGSANHDTVTEAAARISEALDYGVEQRLHLKTAGAARSYLIEAFEELGGLVVVNSMVSNSTKRPLDLEEFRGFTLHSAIAPLVFVNANDTKNGQVFSLLHEFAHVWRGAFGVSAGGDPLVHHTNEIERWCDAVAAEIAVPRTDLIAHFHPDRDLIEELEVLAKRYICSTLVVLLRLRENNLVEGHNFQAIYDAEVARLKDIILKKPSADGGDFYMNQRFRIGETLSHAIIRDTKRGATSMTEALRLLGFKGINMFDTYAARLGEA